VAELEAGDLGRRKVAVVLLGRPGGDGSSDISSDLSKGLEAVRPQAQPPRPVRGSEVCHKQWGADYGRRHVSQVVFGRGPGNACPSRLPWVRWIDQQLLMRNTFFKISINTHSRIAHTVEPEECLLPRGRSVLCAEEFSWFCQNENLPLQICRRDSLPQSTVVVRP